MNVFRNPLVIQALAEKDRQIAEAGVLFDFQNLDQRPYSGSRREGDVILNEVGHRHKIRIKMKIKTAIIEMNATNQSLRRLGLKIDTMILVPVEQHDQLKFDIKTTPQTNREEQLIMQDEDYLFIKENFNFSDAQWTVLRSIKPDFPSLYNIEKQKREINHLFTINEIVDMGYYVEPADWITWNLQEIASNNHNLFINKKIHIKIALDGFLLVRQTTLLNFSFAVINEGSVAASAKGTYALGFFQIEKENYEQLNQIVPEVWAKISAIREFTFNGQTHEIEYFDANDHKMQALVIFSYQSVCLHVFKNSNYYLQ
jgi:hypothetical protein